MSSRAWARLMAVCLLALAVPCLLASRSASARQTGGLRVQVVNGTPGGGAVVGLPVAVYVVDDNTEKIAAQGETDKRGAYSLPELTGSGGARFVVSTTYAGVAYHTEPVDLPAPDLALKVYEPTEDDTKISVSNAGIVILDVNAETQIIKILETATLLNSGDRTFVPGTAGPRGPMGLLRFGLPEGAGNLIAGEELAAATIIQVDTGFATDLPLPPGDTNVSYGYEIAYGALREGGYAQVSKNMPYATEVLRVLAVEGDFSLESPQLSDEGPATVGARTYRQLVGANLAPRSELTLDLRNLPLIQPALRPGNAWLQVAVALLAGMAALLPVLYRRVYSRRNPPVRATGNVQSEEAVRKRPAIVRRVTGHRGPEGKPGT